ncbi:MAG: nitroreductase family protein [Anaerolineae bacterium]|nr:nitroreductase family protein [Anaerolineae bacterium]
MDRAAVDHLLTTTRSVRKRLDLTRPVEAAVIAECLEIAIQAPTASNRQNWHFMIVTDAEKRQQVARYYHQSFFDHYIAHARQQNAGNAQTTRALDSAEYLAANMHLVPVLILPCVEGRPTSPEPFAQAGFYGSILPATWSLMLALRARGLGSAWTTLHLRYEQEVAQVLGIPDTITQAALLPVAYFTGNDFQPAKRRPAREVTYWDAWGKTR